MPLGVTTRGRAPVGSAGVSDLGKPSKIATEGSGGSDLMAAIRGRVMGRERALPLEGGGELGVAGACVDGTIDVVGLRGMTLGSDRSGTATTLTSSRPRAARASSSAGIPRMTGDVGGGSGFLGLSAGSLAAAGSLVGSFAAGGNTTAGWTPTSRRPASVRSGWAKAGSGTEPGSSSATITLSSLPAGAAGTPLGFLICARSLA
jgi:hypothetical protein